MQKTMYKGISKLVSYVALCNTCNANEVSNEHKTSRAFITHIRTLGWYITGKNEVYCKECYKSHLKERRQ